MLFSKNPRGNHAKKLDFDGIFDCTGVVNGNLLYTVLAQGSVQRESKQVSADWYNAVFVIYSVAVRRDQPVCMNWEAIIVYL